MTDLPELMSYIDFPEPGPPNTLKISQGPLPTINGHDVLIKVHAAGVNYPDIIQRKGHYPPPEGASPILGLEVSGEIVATGPNVSKWNIGDQVCALTNGGGYAEYAAVPEGQCLQIPAGVTLAEAASLPEDYFTVWHNLFELGELKAGEDFLVHGGSGGIGSTAVQLANAFGAKVYTTCGNEDHCEFAKNLGAHEIINYKTTNFYDQIMEATGHKGVDVILDYIAGDYFPKDIALLKLKGRSIEIAALRGNEVTLDIYQVLFKRLTITGSALRPMNSEEKTAIANGLIKNVWPLFDQKKIKPVVSKIFDFKDVVKAHEHMESDHIGKLVIKISD